MTCRRFRSQGGFTLIELSLVIAIVGLLLGGSLYGIQSWTERGNDASTRTKIRAVESALTFYVMSNARLPCPDTDATPDGAENGGGTGACTGGVDVAVGGVPYSDLGLTRAEVVDAWGAPLRYAVFDDLTDLDQLACPGGATTGLSAAGELTVDGAPTGAAQQGAYVVVSSGETGGFEGENAIQGLDPPPAPALNADFTEVTRDDILATRSPAKILVDGGCRYARLDPYSDDGDEGNTSEDPAGGDLGGPDKLISRSDDDGPSKKTVKPIIDEPEGKPTQLDFATSGKVDGTGAASCQWWKTDFRLRHGTIRSYFQVAFEDDPALERRHGLVLGFLPWEVSASENGTGRCGGPEEDMGFANNSSAQRLLIEDDDYDPQRESVLDSFAIGVELDTQYTSVNNRQDDPNQPNHLAIILNDNSHEDGYLTPSSENNAAVPNPDCDGQLDKAGGCQYRTSNNSTAFENGRSNYNTVRMEIEHDSATCADKVEVRAWVWPNGTSCVGSCANLSSNFDDSQETGNVHAVSYCIQQSPYQIGNNNNGVSGTLLGRTENNLATWAKLRVGLTSGIPQDTSRRSNPRVQKFLVVASPRRTSGGDAGINDSVLINSADAKTNKDGITSAAVNSAGGNYAAGWLRTGWIPWHKTGDIYDVNVYSSMGEITVSAQGFGVFGVGGAGTETVSAPDPVPPLDNVGTANAWKPESSVFNRERLMFDVDKYYTSFAVKLQGFSTTDGDAAEEAVLHLVKFDAGYDAEPEVATATVSTAGCPVGNTGTVEIRLTGAANTRFNSISIVPDPNGDAGSTFYVEKVKACGGSGCTTGDAVGCTITATATVPD